MAVRPLRRTRPAVFENPITPWRPWRAEGSLLQLGDRTCDVGRFLGAVGEAPYPSLMESLTPWLNPALIVAVGLFVWRRLDRMEARIHGRLERIETRLNDLDRRLAKVEGWIEGFRTPAPPHRP